MAVFLWLFASVVWGQNVSQGPQELLVPQSGGQVLELPVVPAPRPIQVVQRLKRFDEERIPGSERTPSIPPSEVEDRLIFEPVLDRWRIGYRRNILDPYNQNVPCRSQEGQHWSYRLGQPPDQSGWCSA